MIGDPAQPAIVPMSEPSPADFRRLLEGTREAGFDHQLVKPAEIEALRDLLASLG